MITGVLANAGSVDRPGNEIGASMVAVVDVSVGVGDAEGLGVDVEVGVGVQVGGTGVGDAVGGAVVGVLDGGRADGASSTVGVTISLVETGPNCHATTPTIESSAIPAMTSHLNTLSQRSISITRPFQQCSLKPMQHATMATLDHNRQLDPPAVPNKIVVEMPTERVGLGRRGEHLAAQALTAAGYQLIDRNWRCHAGEVDLVARRGDELYFVEVRTRRSTASPAPEESLIRRKVTRMETVARIYLGTHTTKTSTWHLSFVAVTMDRGGRLRRVSFYPDLQGEPEDLISNR